MSADFDTTTGEGATGDLVSGFSAASSLKVGSRNWAVGLVWEAADLTPVKGGKPVAVAVQARNAAKKQQADLFCARETQYGLGSSAVGHKAAQLPLAAFLADKFGENWIGVFAVESGWYLIAVRDEMVLSDCDRVIKDRQEALNAFTDLVYGSTWKDIYAPEDWDIDGAKRSTLADILDGQKTSGPFDALLGRKTDAKLQTVSQTGRLVKLGAVALLGLVGAIAYKQYQDYIAEQAAELVTVVPFKPAPPPPPPPMPWEGKPRGVPTLLACIEAMMAADIHVAGWKSEALVCEGGSVALQLARDGGTINWIGASLNREGFKPVVAPTGADTAIASWQLGPLEPMPKEIPTASLRDVRRYLLSHFEEIFHRVEMTPGESTAWYSGLAFSFRTAHAPKEFARILEPVPGLLVNKVKLDLATWTWTIEGNVYEKLPEPKVGAPQ